MSDELRGVAAELACTDLQRSVAWMSEPARMRCCCAADGGLALWRLSGQMVPVVRDLPRAGRDSLTVVVDDIPVLAGRSAVRGQSSGLTIRVEMRNLDCVRFGVFAPRPA